MSVLSSRVDVTRTRFSTKTRPDTGPGAPPVRLTIQKVSGEHQNSSGRAKLGRKSHGGAPRRTPAGSQPGECDVTAHYGCYDSSGPAGGGFCHSVRYYAETGWKLCRMT